MALHSRTQPPPPFTSPPSPPPESKCNSLKHLEGKKSRRNFYLCRCENNSMDYQMHPCYWWNSSPHYIDALLWSRPDSTHLLRTSSFFPSFNQLLSLSSLQYLILSGGNCGKELSIVLQTHTHKRKYKNQSKKTLRCETMLQVWRTEGCKERHQVMWEDVTRFYFLFWEECFFKE